MFSSINGRRLALEQDSALSFLVVGWLDWFGSEGLISRTLLLSTSVTLR
jgi:hypothetical protein